MPSPNVRQVVKSFIQVSIHNLIKSASTRDTAIVKNANVAKHLSSLLDLYVVVPADNVQNNIVRYITQTVKYTNNAADKK